MRTFILQRTKANGKHCVTMSVCLRALIGQNTEDTSRQKTACTGKSILLLSLANISYCDMVIYELFWETSYATQTCDEIGIIPGKKCILFILFLFINLSAFLVNCVEIIDS